MKLLAFTRSRSRVLDRAMSAGRQARPTAPPSHAQGRTINILLLLHRVLVGPSSRLAGII